MKNFSVPFTIGYPNTKDYVLAKCYEEKRESYRLAIPAGKQLKEPIKISFRSSAKTLDLSLQIELGKGASATLIEDWDGELQSPTIRFTNHVKCHTNSVLTYIVLHNVPTSTDIMEDRTSDIGEDAQCHIYGYYFGGRKMISHLVQTASQKGAGINSYMVANSTATQHLNLSCEHKYTAKLGSGEIGMKGIAQDEATLNFEGLISIGAKADGSAGYLKQEILNINSHTTVRAIPGLKIETSNVKAGHSASVRNLNDEDLFYFGARGIEKEMAKKLLIAGFLGREMKQIENCGDIYETIRKLI